MNWLEDRLRRDLPALAELLMEDEAAPPSRDDDTMADGPHIVVEIGAQPAPRRRRWPAIAAAALVATVAGVATLIIAVSDSTEVTITVSEQPTAPSMSGAVSEQPTAPSMSGAVSEEPTAPSTSGAVSEQPGVGNGRDSEPARPGEGVRVLAGRADWSSGYFQAALYKRLLEELGYDVSHPAELELNPSVAYTAMAQSEMDYWPNSWYPAHSGWLAQELPDGSTVADHVAVVGEQMISGSAQGYLVTKSFADTYGVYTLDDLNDNAEALAAYDATDPVPGNGKAEIYGCAQYWTCDDIIDNQIAFSGWDSIVQVRGDYDAHFAIALENVNNDVPVVVYTWVPSRYITLLRPGDNVYWMGVGNILDDSNPTGVQHGHEHDQRGPDGTGGFAAIGPDECPSAAEQPDGRCPIGWLTHDILVTANTEFLEANPAARALLEEVKLTVLEVSLAHETAGTDGIDPDELAAQWIDDNRDRVDAWLAVARAAG
ncbi:MAG: hypothetical protein F4Z34_11035 [Acidimicrobiaceae bacterium]|nr:hypothetical protein [Acidimicrobiaceae bacterium]MYJ11673.1 hypothetical protein [Gemmatimonadota bacterium]